MSKAKTSAVTTSAVTKKVEFTKDNPLLVIVGIVQNQWTIQTSTTDTFPPDGKLYSVKMNDRLSAIPGGRPSLKTNWHGRAIVGAAAAPQFIQDPNHHPIVVRPNEYVRFQCDYPLIMVSANRDKSVLPDPNSPDSPFTWPNGQKSTQTAPPYFVIGVAQDNIHQQRFYKTEAYVDVPGQQPAHPDPDTVGSTDGGL
jgi:hypothetical protein